MIGITKTMRLGASCRGGCEDRVLHKEMPRWRPDSVQSQGLAAAPSLLLWWLSPEASTVGGTVLLSCYKKPNFAVYHKMPDLLSK